jgi:hypothetical protein
MIILLLVLLLTAIGLLFYLLKTIKNIGNKLEGEIEEMRDKIERKMNFSINVPLSYETVVMDEKNNRIISTSQDSYLPHIPSKGDIFSLASTDMGYVESTVTKVNHYRTKGRVTTIFIYVANIEKKEIPVNFKEVEEFKKAFSNKQ